MVVHSSTTAWYEWAMELTLFYEPTQRQVIISGMNMKKFRFAQRFFFFYFFCCLFGTLATGWLNAIFDDNRRHFDSKVYRYVIKIDIFVHQHYILMMNS